MQIQSFYANDYQLENWVGKKSTYSSNKKKHTGINLEVICKISVGEKN